MRVMENISGFVYSRINTQMPGTLTDPGVREKSGDFRNRMSARIVSEGGNNLLEYINDQGIPAEGEIMVLSQDHHYYYDESDLKNIRVLVNIKKLNLIERLDMFLDTLFRILPPEADFIGCFTDSRMLKRDNGFTLYHSTKLLNQLISILDSKTNHYMNRDQVLSLFAANGFKVYDMTEKDGLTYFHAKSIRKKAELRA